MTIETKYNIGDEVWYMSYNRIEHSKIKGYQISYGEYYGNVFTKGVKYSITYAIQTGGIVYDIVHEKDLFPTKEELLKSL